MKIIKYLIIVISLISIISGCGYKLRSYENISPQPSIQLIYETNLINNKFIEGLKQSINSSSIYFNEPDKKTNYTLKILNISLEKFSNSLSLLRASSEARLNFSLTYTLKNNTSSELTNHEIRYEKSFPYDESKILSNQNEEVIIFEEFIRDAIAEIYHSLLSFDNL